MKKDNRMKLLNKETGLVNRLAKQVKKLAVAAAPKTAKKKPKSQRKTAQTSVKSGSRHIRAVDAMLDPTVHGKVPVAMGTGDTSQSLSSYTFNCSAHWSTLVADTVGENMVLIAIHGGIAGSPYAMTAYIGTQTSNLAGVTSISTEWRDRPTFVATGDLNTELTKINGLTFNIKYSGSMIQRLGLCHTMVAHDHASAANMESVLDTWYAGSSTLQNVRAQMTSSRYHKYVNFALGEEEDLVVPVRGQWCDLANDSTLEGSYWVDAPYSVPNNTVVAIALLDMGTTNTGGQTYPVGFTIELRIAGEIHSQANRMFLTPSPLASTATNRHVTMVSQAISHITQKRLSGVTHKDAVTAALGLGKKFLTSKSGKKAAQGAMMAGLGLIL